VADIIVYKIFLNLKFLFVGDGSLAGPPSSPTGSAPSTVQNLVVWVTMHLGFVYPCILPYLD